ncbi:hypothetical protein GCM10009795_028700 [Nocardioides hankookensis]|uniref:Uncharacterized protein n=1 Tax=Nocardioides hankookensis TaxID=443157 RepID=A0ABW1LD48_9ACTN
MLGSVDHDLGDRVVLEQRFEDAEPQRLVDRTAHHAAAFAVGEQRSLTSQQRADHAFEAGPLRLVGQRRELAEVDLGQQQPPQVGGHVVVDGAAEAGAGVDVVVAGPDPIAQ